MEWNGTVQYCIVQNRIEQNYTEENGIKSYIIEFKNSKKVKQDTVVSKYRKKQYRIKQN